MIHQYTETELGSFDVKAIKSICLDLGIDPAFRKSACIKQIIDVQDDEQLFAQAELEQLLEEQAWGIAPEAQPITCATCPYFNPEQGVHGWCTAFDQAARSHHKRTAACDIEIEQIEAEEKVVPSVGLAGDSVAVALKPVEKAASRLEAYTTPDPTVYAVYSHKAQYIQPKRYQVKSFGGDLFACTCPHHRHRGGECKHIKQVVLQVLDGSTTMLREPIKLELNGDGFSPAYNCYLGKDYLGIAATKEEGEAIADRWFNSARVIYQQNQLVSSSYSVN